MSTGTDRLAKIEERLAAHSEHREGPYAEDVRTATADLAALVEMVKAVRGIHQKVTTYGWADTCPLRTDDDHAVRWHVESDEADEYICLDSPEAEVCSHCRDTDEEATSWPCSTVAAMHELEER